MSHFPRLVDKIKKQGKEFFVMAEKFVLNNRDEIAEQLTDMLMQFDKAANQYQTDVYLYYNKETQTATLDTFTNVGGNSWLDDDHYVLHRDKEHYEGTAWDWCQSVGEYLDVLKVSEKDLKAAVIKYLALDEEDAEDYELDLTDIESFIKNNEQYRETLFQAYCSSVDENRSVYYDNAVHIVDRFVEETNENRDYHD